MKLFFFSRPNNSVKGGGFSKYRLDFGSRKINIKKKKSSSLLLKIFFSSDENHLCSCKKLFRISIGTLF